MMVKNISFVVKEGGEVRRELLRYFLVGAFGFFLNLTFLYFFTEVLNFYYLFSAVIAGVLAGFFNFCLDKVWSFKEELRLDFFKKYFYYILVSGTALIMGVGVLYVLTEIMNIYYLVSQAIAIFFLGIFTFVSNKAWTFNNCK